MLLDLHVDKRLPGFQLRAQFVCDAGIIVLFGPSGSGKSLTLQCLAGTIGLDRGRIAVDGRVLFDSASGIAVSPRHRQIGYVPQSYALFPHMSVAENIAFGLRRRDRSAATKRVSDLVAMFHLSGLEKRRPRELSGGQQQRVAMARALAINPKLLLLDEPFSALDAEIRDTLRGDLLDVHQLLGVNIVLVTHGVVDTYALADVVAVYKGGRVLQVGSPHEVFRRPASVEVARLTGARNVLVGTTVAVGPRDCCVDVNGVRLQTTSRATAVGEPVLVTIRPEDARLIADGEAVEDDEEVVPCIVQAVASQGHLYGVDVGLGSACEPSLHVLVPVWWWQRHGLGVGSECRLAVARASINVLCK